LQIPVYTWNKPSSGRCDYPFATVYWRIGMDRYADSETQFIEPTRDSYASKGVEIAPDGTTQFLPERHSGGSFDDYLN